ncbi:MAG TPA: 4-hydroxy-tetrahydrodipicolinate reductase [Allosphingosinicella sp.]
MTSIGILGVRGRMGQAVAGAIEEVGFTVAGGVDRDGYFVGDHRDAMALAEACDVLVDFSAPDAIAGHLDAAVAAGTPIVIGTTGITNDHHDAIDEAAESVAVVQAFNMSLGVNLLAALVEQAARRLGPEWDIEIVEMHHRHKLDTPSGTALLLGASANVGRGATRFDEKNRYDRMQDGPHQREEGGIYYASLRGGSVSGDHVVVFASEGERLELGHRAEARSIFAKGAVKAAAWLADKPAGRYTMADVLGFE